MQRQQCGCGSCGACRKQRETTFEVMQFDQQEWGGGSRALAPRRRAVAPFSEADEMELVMELMEVSSEEELDQFLGNMFKKVWSGIKKVGSVVGKIAKPLLGAVKGIAKVALPFVGGALGSFIPIPGVGTALGSALGGALSKALELEFEGMEFEQQEFEMARRFVRIAGSAAQNAAQGDGSPRQLRASLVDALQKHAPQLVLPGGPEPEGARGQRQGAQGEQWEGGQNEQGEQWQGEQNEQGEQGEQGGQGEMRSGGGPASGGRWRRRGPNIVVMGDW